MKAREILEAVDELCRYCQKHQYKGCKSTCLFGFKCNDSLFCALDYFKTQTGQEVIEDAVRRIYPK